MPAPTRPKSTHDHAADAPTPDPESGEVIIKSRRSDSDRHVYHTDADCPQLADIKTPNSVPTSDPRVQDLRECLTCQGIQPQGSVEPYNCPLCGQQVVAKHTDGNVGELPGHLEYRCPVANRLRGSEVSIQAAIEEYAANRGDV